MKKRLFILALCLVMVVSLLAGCGGDKSTTENQGEDTETASGSVYWLNFKPESDEVLQQVAQMYTEKTGVPVKVVTAASGTYSQTLTSEMDKSAPPTLFNIGNMEGVKTWSDYALDLNGTAIANELKLPVKYVGVGEGMDDLIPFDATNFVEALFK